MNEELLIVDELSVTYGGTVRAVDRLSLRLQRGRSLGVMGESGSGKSTFTRVLLGVADEAAIVGSVELAGRQLVGLAEARWRDVRWRTVAWAPQQTGSLNPTLDNGEQIAEVLRVHGSMRRRDAAERAEQLLAEFGLDPALAYCRPSELSGGQRRLVLVAQAFACDPALVVLDEPSAGLDPMARDHLVAALRARREAGATLIVCSHDIELLRRVADDIAVLYRGWLAEMGPAARVMDDAASPYSWALLNAVPTLSTLKELRGIRAAGNVEVPAVGCPFAGRCTQEVDRCRTDRPVLQPVISGERAQRDHSVSCLRGGRVDVLEAKGLRHRYQRRSTHPTDRYAVDGIDVRLRSGEVLGIAGSNGAGKSTLALLLARLLDSEGGTVKLDGEDARELSRGEARRRRRHLQLVQQDPFEAISPRLTVAEVVREPLQLIGTVDGEQRDTVERALRDVRLPTTGEFLARRSHQLSGGQLQRLSVARALVIEPRVLVLDEPVAMLDPSEAAELLQLLKAAQVERGMAMILISHDLAVLLRVADRVMVLDGGRVVEEATGAALLRDPQAPLTKALLAASRVHEQSQQPEPVLLPDKGGT